MDIDIHYNRAGIKHLSVRGIADKKKDVEDILEQINNTKGKIHITFFDANIINGSIAEKLYDLQKEKRSKIFVLKQYLYSYLYKLGIECKLIHKKPIWCENKIQRYHQGDLFEKDQIIALLEGIRNQYGYDYTQYQIDSIMRRIRICMLRESIYSFHDFKNAVLQREELFEQLFLDLSINITEFFRDPHVFKEIRHRILPYLDSFSHIKIWCAGCSTGQEAYSMAIILHELGILHKSQIYATDINPFVIEEAKNGLFSLEYIDKSINNYRNAHGERSFTEYFDLHTSYMKAKHFLKSKILFFQHSLVGSGILNEFQLILCRNVLIYFNKKLQQQTLEKFRDSLDISGFLILGKSEGINHNKGHQYFYNYQLENKIFKGRSNDTIKYDIKSSIPLESLKK